MYQIRLALFSNPIREFCFCIGLKTAKNNHGGKKPSPDAEEAKREENEGRSDQFHHTPAFTICVLCASNKQNIKAESHLVHIHT